MAKGSGFKKQTSTNDSRFDVDEYSGGLMLLFFSALSEMDAMLCEVDGRSVPGDAS